MAQIYMQRTGHCAQRIQPAHGLSLSPWQTHRMTRVNQYNAAHKGNFQNMALLLPSAITGMHTRPGSVLQASAATAEQAPIAMEDASSSQICTSVTATSVDAFLVEIQEAAASGVDIIELRLDFLTDFDPEQHLQKIMAACPLPYIVTYRPLWEG